MRLIRIAFWAIIAICLIIVGLGNRGMVTLRAMPVALGDLLGVSPDVQLPLFVVIMGGVGIGLLIGFLWEWLREYRQRAESRMRGREVVNLQREVERLRTARNVGKDDVLVLLDAPAARR